MNKLLVFLAFFITLAYNGVPVASQKEASMNDYMDLVMPDIADWLIANGLDPMDLPDITEEFEYQPLLITYHGQLYLTKGVISNLREISRYGDSVISYGFQLLRLRTGAAMKSLQFRFDYDANVMNLGPSGWLEGSVENVNIHCDFIFDMYDFYLYLQDFQVTSIGYIDVKVRGNILIDWLANIFIKIVTTLFRSTLTEYIAGNVYDVAQQTIDNINSQISGSVRQQMIMDFLGNVTQSKIIV